MITKVSSDISTGLSSNSDFRLATTLVSMSMSSSSSSPASLWDKCLRRHTLGQPLKFPRRRCYPTPDLCRPSGKLRARRPTARCRHVCRGRPGRRVGLETLPPAGLGRGEPLLCLAQDRAELRRAVLDGRGRCHRAVWLSIVSKLRLSGLYVFLWRGVVFPAMCASRAALLDVGRALATWMGPGCAARWMSRWISVSAVSLSLSSRLLPVFLFSSSRLLLRPDDVCLTDVFFFLRLPNVRHLPHVTPSLAN